MAEISNLVIQVDSDGVAKASGRLDELSRSSKTAETQTRQMGKGMGVADKNVGQYSQATTIAAADTKKLTTSLDMAEQEARQMAKGMDGAGNSSTNAGKKMKAAGKASNVVRGNFGAMKGATQNLSYQLQDVAVQAQAGTSAFIILGQQGPQIASIFGPGGAVFGVLIAVGAMIGGVLYNSIFKAKGGVEDLEESLLRLEDQVVRNTGGVLEFSRKLEALAKVSSAAAAAQIVSGMDDARTAILGSTNAIDGMIDGLTGIDLAKVNADIEKLRKRGFNDADFVAPVESYTTAVSDISPVLTEVSQALGISRTEALAFVQAAGSLDKKNIGTYNNLRDVVDEITVAQRGLSPEMANLYRDMAQNDGVIRDAGESLKFFKQNLRTVMEGGTLTGVIEGDADAEAARLKKLADEKARQQKVDDAALARQQKAFADRDSREIEAANKKYEAKSLAAQKFLDQVTMLGLTEEQAFTERQTRITARLKMELQARTLSETEYAEGIAALQREADLRALEARSGYLLAWQEQTTEAMTNMDMMGANMAQSLTTNMSGAFESILTGTASAKDAFKSFAVSMASSMVGALAEMAAQYIAYQLVQKAVGKAAQAGEASAMSLNASAGVAMAGLNAFASTAAIPIVGPVLAPAAAAAAIAATTPMATAVAAMSSAAVGARALGGQVRGGESYLVGERGPELLHMGTSGRVVPNDKLGGGGGSVTIVNNVDAAGGGADVDIKIQQAMMQTNRQTVAQVQDLLKRGRLT